MKALKVISFFTSVVLLVNCFIGCSKGVDDSLKSEAAEQVTTGDEALIRERIRLFFKAYNQGDMETVISCFDAKTRNAVQAMFNIGGAVAGSAVGFNLNLADLFALGVNTTSGDFMDLQIGEIKMTDEKRAIVTTTMSLAGSGNQTVYFIMVYEDGGWYINDMTDKKEGGISIGDIDTSFLTNITPSEGLEFDLNWNGDGYTLRYMGDCKDNHVVIPEYPVEYNDVPVTAVSFVDITAEYVTVPKSVTRVGGENSKIKAINYLGTLEDYLNMTFESNPCSEGALLFINGEAVMGALEIPETASKVSSRAFWGYSHITSVSIDSQIVEDRAFSECKNLKRIDISDGVKEIGKNAFSGCSALEHITLGNSIEEMGEYAFDGTAYYNDQKNWENGILYVGSYLYAANEDVINVTVKNGTLGIWGGAFKYKYHLKNVTLSDSVKIIGTVSFYYCRLETFTAGNGLRIIKKNAFGWCSIEQLQVNDLSSLIIEEGNDVIESK